MGCEDANFRGIGLSSRKNLCLNPEVSRCYCSSFGRWEGGLVERWREAEGRRVEAHPPTTFTSRFGFDRSRKRKRAKRSMLVVGI